MYIIVTYYEQFIMNNQIKKIREKLDLYAKKYIDREMLEKILTKFGPSYSVQDISRKWLITPLKRGKYYMNNLSREYKDPFKTADMYFEWDIYAFGWLGVYAMYGYSTQVIERYTVYNTKISGERIIGNVKFIFSKQRESFFYGIVSKKNNIGTYKVMSPERAFIQMLKEWKTFKNIPENIDASKLLTLAKKYATKNLFDEISQLCS